MRFHTLLGLAASLTFAACSASTASSGDDATAGSDTGAGDLGLTFDVAQNDSGAGTDQPDVAAGTDAETVKDVVDVQEPADVPPPQDIVDVPAIKDVPPPQDIQVQPDVQAPQDTGSAPDVPEPECPSGVKWLLQDWVHSDLMEPGLACNACHAKKGPIFSVAGTVYPGFHTVDTCNGVSGIKVEITDANGKVTTLSTNLAGNFKSSAAIALPYTARVIDDKGGERKMYDAQTNGDCNVCHTAKGDQGAPGRIRAP